MNCCEYISNIFKDIRDRFNPEFSNFMPPYKKRKNSETDYDNNDNNDKKTDILKQINVLEDQLNNLKTEFMEYEIQRHNRKYKLKQYTNTATQTGPYKINPLDENIPPILTQRRSIVITETDKDIQQPIQLCIQSINKMVIPNKTDSPNKTESPSKSSVSSEDTSSQDLSSWDEIPIKNINEEKINSVDITDETPCEN